MRCRASGSSSAIRMRCGCRFMVLLRSPGQVLSVCLPSWQPECHRINVVLMAVLEHSGLAKQGLQPGLDVNQGNLVAPVLLAAGLRFRVLYHQVYKMPFGVGLDPHCATLRFWLNAVVDGVLYQGLQGQWRNGLLLQAWLYIPVQL